MPRLARAFDRSKVRTSKIIYGHISGPTSITKINRQIRNDIEQAGDRSEITELVARSRYLWAIVQGPNLETKLKNKGKYGDTKQRVKDEYNKTAKKANRRAKELGFEANYDITLTPGGESKESAPKTKYTETEEKYEGPTKVWWLIYDAPHEYRDGSIQDRTYAKRVYVSGTLKKKPTTPGKVKNRLGNTKYGVKIKFVTKREGFDAKRSDTGTKYHTKSTEIPYEKVVEVPKDAKNLRWSKKKPKEAMDIE